MNVLNEHSSWLTPKNNINFQKWKYLLPESGNYFAEQTITEARLSYDARLVKYFSCY
jgi:hypothetical protein